MRWVYVPRRPAIDLIPVLVDPMIWGIANTAVHVPPEQAGASENRDALIARIAAEASTRMV